MRPSKALANPYQHKYPRCSTVQNEIDNSILCQKWIHSHEEDTASGTVYRPVAFAFPPSRGREEIDLRPDGIVQGQTAGPSDRRQSRSGSWTIEHGILKINLPTSDRTWKVQELADDKLILCPLGT